MMKRITTPLTASMIASLKAGDEVLLSGTVYTARDQAHKRICEALAAGKKPPFALRGQVVYYCGPTNTPKGEVIGACGPTTSGRMDGFAPLLMRAGLSGMIGKGGRSAHVTAAIRGNRCVYFLAYAGCGALLTRYVTKATTVAYRDLGPEAVRRLEVKDFPLVVGIDARGASVFKNKK